MWLPKKINLLTFPLLLHSTVLPFFVNTYEGSDDNTQWFMDIQKGYDNAHSALEVWVVEKKIAEHGTITQSFCNAQGSI